MHDIDYEYEYDFNLHKRYDTNNENMEKMVYVTID